MGYYDGIILSKLPIKSWEEVEQKREIASGKKGRGDLPELIYEEVKNATNGGYFSYHEATYPMGAYELDQQDFLNFLEKHKEEIDHIYCVLGLLREDLTKEDIEDLNFHVYYVDWQ